MILLAVDPGKTTGYAVWSEGKLALAEQVEHFSFLEWAEEVVPTYQVWGLQVVCESFRIGLETVTKAKDAHWALKQIGCLEYWCQKYDVPFETQDPGAAKAFVKDARLKKLGWYRPGKPHANDALRHAVKRLVDLRLLPLDQLAATPDVVL